MKRCFEDKRDWWAWLLRGKKPGSGWEQLD
jgi:hypothetical protein